jgi:TPR repeat protein
LVEGIGLPLEQGNGAALVRRAADEGDIIAMVFHARYLEEGKVVDRDLAKAACWYKRALDRGCLGARPGYDRCSQGGLAKPEVEF